MKVSLTIAIALLAGQAFASGLDGGFTNADKAVSAFLQPAGPSAADKSLSVTPEQGKPAVGASGASGASVPARNDAVENPMSKQLSALVATQGKLISIRKTDEETKLGGKMIKQTYSLFFQRGGKKEATFTVMQPTMTGGFMVMDLTINDLTDAQSEDPARK
jgi:hypothetical protein